MGVVEGEVERVDIAVVGAGAAGLMAAIAAARTFQGQHLPARIVALDGARSLGAKILVAGGGRCNVTHERVGPEDYAGSSRNAIAKVLRQLSVEQTITFFRELGVELKREETGKLFPTTNRARTVLDALLGAVRAGGVDLRFPARVESVEPFGGGFRITGSWGELVASRVILAAGGSALPKSGSDGSGFLLAAALGHSVTTTFPSLVPLCLPDDHPLCALSGISTPARAEVRASSGKRLFATTGSLLCTHFGLSGPVILDVSRHLIAARREDPGANLHLAFLPELDRGALEAEILNLGRRNLGTWLGERLPDRLATTLLALAGADPAMSGQQCPRETRKRLVEVLGGLDVPVIGDRGFEKAEATAGGVPLAEVHLDTMESRIQPGLFLCGEVLDVDGRIGGFNFQWAWSSGTSAGRGAARSVTIPP